MSVVVAGVGLVPFRTPRLSETYDVLGERAARAALADAGIDIADVDQAYAGYVYADSAAGQTVLYGVGATGIPIVNVNNYCASGSTALWLGRQAILSGLAQCVLVVGFEQMARGAIGSGSPSSRRTSGSRSITLCSARINASTGSWPPSRDRPWARCRPSKWGRTGTPVR